MNPKQGFIFFVFKTKEEAPAGLFPPGLFLFYRENSTKE
jgi:hypothetical protein